MLGAGIRPDGTPCDILKDRLFTAAKVYNEGICRKVLLTGEHRDEDYSEIFSMKNWIMQYNIAEKDIILEMYSHLTPRRAIIEAEKGGLISKMMRDHYLLDYPDLPAIEEVLPKESYTLQECRETFDLFANKFWSEMSSQEIDAVLDTYDPEMKRKALSYLRMRGGHLDDGD